MRPIAGQLTSWTDKPGLGFITLSPGIGSEKFGVIKWRKGFVCVLTTVHASWQRCVCACVCSEWKPHKNIDRLLFVPNYFRAPPRMRVTAGCRNRWQFSFSSSCRLGSPTSESRPLFNCQAHTLVMRSTLTNSHCLQTVCAIIAQSFTVMRKIYTICSAHELIPQNDDPIDTVYFLSA